MKTFEVSVVIPARDAGRVLGRALESVRRQTLAPAEVVVVDDGSGDDTAEVAAASGAGVVRQGHAGVSAARNRGIETSAADWVAFLDADDEWLPFKLERQARVLERNPSLVWCAGNREWLRGGAFRAAPLPGSFASPAAGEAVPFFAAAAAGVSLQTSGFVVRRSVFTEVGLFDPSLSVSEDRDMWWRIAMRHPRIAYCRDACYRYHEDTPTSLMRGSPDRTPSLTAVCRNMRRAREAGPEAAAAFAGYARSLAADYLNRGSGRLITLDGQTVREAQELFPPTASEKLLRRALALLPRPVARWMLR
jgi:glycosyltransferase involved in cell wall biosynthesis